jgi:glycerate 2-kinase
VVRVTHRGDTPSTCSGRRNRRAEGHGSTTLLADEPGTGAAGGLGFACRWLGASRVAGAEFFLDLLGFDAAVSECAAVVTGEGRMDGQTLAGKLPAVVAARSAPRRVHAVVGQSLLTEDERLRLGLDEVVALRELTDEDPNRDPDLSKRLAAVAGALIGRQVRSLTVAGRSARTAGRTMQRLDPTAAELVSGGNSSR